MRAFSFAFHKLTRFISEKLLTRCPFVARLCGLRTRMVALCIAALRWAFRRVVSFRFSCEHGLGWSRDAA